MSGPPGRLRADTASDDKATPWAMILVWLPWPKLPVTVALLPRMVSYFKLAEGALASVCSLLGASVERAAAA